MGCARLGMATDRVDRAFSDNTERHEDRRAQARGESVAVDGPVPVVELVTCADSFEPLGASAEREFVPERRTTLFHGDAPNLIVLPESAPHGPALAIVGEMDLDVVGASESRNRRGIGCVKAMSTGGKQPRESRSRTDFDDRRWATKGSRRDVPRGVESPRKEGP